MFNKSFITKAQSFLLSVCGIFFLSAVCPAQIKKTSANSTATNESQTIRSSPAYAEILLRKTDLEAEVEDLLINYTEDFPKVKETRYQLGLVNASLNKLLAVREAEASKLTLALGKLLVRKAELDTDLWSLKNKFGDEHIEVKRAARKAAIFDKAVKEIMP